MLTVQPLFIQAVWWCLCCHRIQTSTRAGVLYDGQILLGLVCPDHTPEDLETCRSQTKQAIPIPST